MKPFFMGARMARIRTIKPEFFTSSDILSLTPLARLFYVSLWCEADREGLLKWDPDTLKFRYFPKDKIEIESLGNELRAQGLIEILVGTDGKEYAEIPSFKNHQIINNRESDSILISRVKEASPRVQAEGKEGREGKGKEGKGKEDASVSPDGDLFPNVDPQVVADFKQLRKQKKAAITVTAMAKIKAEAVKAGMTLEAALRVCCSRGWQGFEADWVLPKAGASGSANGDKFQVANLDHSSSTAAMEASMKRHNIVTPDDGDIPF